MEFLTFDTVTSHSDLSDIFNVFTYILGTFASVLET